MLATSRSQRGVAGHQALSSQPKSTVADGHELRGQLCKEGERVLRGGVYRAASQAYSGRIGKSADRKMSK